MLLELARSRNKIPLPKSIAPPGSIPLPPEQDTLINPNYQLLIPRKQPSQVEETEEEDVPNPNPNPNLPQEQQMMSADQQQPPQAPQRVSFPLVAGAKRPRWEREALLIMWTNYVLFVHLFSCRNPVLLYLIFTLYWNYLSCIFYLRTKPRLYTWLYFLVLEISCMLLLFYQTINSFG